jgi:regulator of protease activity HflC (stomatin/prohibitin superfamily)
MTRVLFVVALSVFSSGCIASCVPAGHTGVMTRFGAVQETTLSEGFNFKAPWHWVTKLDIRTLELMEATDVPSSEGMIVHLDVSLLYRIDPERVATLYQTVGVNYQGRIITPTFRSAIRDVTAEHQAEDLYGPGRETMAAEIVDSLEAELEPRGIIVEQVLLRGIGLPPTLINAIEAKQTADQQAQQMVFVLERETQEAERKRIEAQGIADFQTIVSEGISDELLEWKGIEATLELATSPNAKTLIVGGGENGLPVILNSER